MFKIKSNSFKETTDLGRLLSKVVGEKEVIVLEGDLGGGKTTFVKGLLKGLDYRGRVLSPSFTLVRSYKVKKLSVYHLDLYRLEGEDIFNLGTDDFFYSENSLSLIEWGEKISSNLSSYIKIKFSFLNENERELEFSFFGYNKKKIKFVKNIFKNEFFRS